MARLTTASHTVPVLSIARPRLRAVLAGLIATALLAGCVFDEVSREDFTITFEAAGTIRFANQTEGVLTAEVLNLPPGGDRNAAFDELVDVVTRTAQGQFEDGYLDSSLTRRGEREAVLGFDGRVWIESWDGQRQFGPFLLYRQGPVFWSLVIEPIDDLEDGVSRVCITAESGWTVVEATPSLSGLEAGQEVCLDLAQTEREVVMFERAQD